VSDDINEVEGNKENELSLWTFFKKEKEKKEKRQRIVELCGSRRVII